LAPWCEDECHAKTPIFMVVAGYDIDSGIHVYRY